MNNIDDRRKSYMPMGQVNGLFGLANKGSSKMLGGSKGRKVDGISKPSIITSNKNGINNNGTINEEDQYPSNSLTPQIKAHGGGGSSLGQRKGSVSNKGIIENLKQHR